MEDGQMTEVYTQEKSGFNTVLRSENWCIATIKYGDMYSEQGFNHMKRHLSTDEVFIPIIGGGTLHTCENGVLNSFPLEKGKIYCVRKNTWHYLCVTEDALIAVTENAGLLPEQTERMELECLLRK